MKTAWRSALFVSAADEVRVAKVGERGADVVILDLEDAVRPEDKASARLLLAPTVDRLAARNIPVIVRVNAGWSDLSADLAAASRAGVTALMIPKVESAARLAVISEMIIEAAGQAGLDAPSIIALVESPAGLSELDAIAALPAVIGLAFGTEDFALGLGVPPTPVALDLPCRLIALAAARHGVMALGMPVSIATIADEAAWISAIQVARAIGMTGALCVHPKQVAAANAGFAPTLAEIDAARAVLTAWDGGGGNGRVVQVDGRMIDLPVVLAAQRMLARIA